MGGYSRRKGKSAEREAAEFIRTAWNVDARRSQQYCGTAGDGDLATGLDGVHFEVKARAAHSCFKFLDQAEADGKGKIPLVMLREKGRTRWGVLLFADTAAEFAALLERARCDGKR